MRPIHLTPPEVLYRDPHQQIYRVTADFGTFRKQYYVNDTGVRAGIVAVRAGSVLLVRQYRLLINDVSWEIPGGRVDEGETPVAAAVRECLEETGVRCRDPQPLVFYHMGMDISRNPTHVFYSTDVIQESPPPTFGPEAIGCEWVSLARCEQMIREAKIVDGLTVLGLLAYGRLVLGVQVQESVPQLNS